MSAGFYLTSTSKRRPTAGWYTMTDWLTILHRQGGRCIDCRKPFYRFGWKKSRATHPPPTVGHRIPIVLGGTNWPSNIIAQCGSCNSKQGSRLHSSA